MSDPPNEDDDLGTPRDAAAANHWYRAPAEAGHAWAMICLAYDYETGRGVAQDDAVARHWYGKAAAAGHVSAADRLGI